MSDDDDFSQLDDPAFLSARRRVQEELEHTPAGKASASPSLMSVILICTWPLRILAVLILCLIYM